MNKVGLNYSITCGKFNDSFRLRAVEFFDSYFYLGGRKCEVIKDLGNNRYEVDYIDGTHTCTALKVASWFLTAGILPLIMLVGRLISRKLLTEFYETQKDHFDKDPLIGFENNDFQLSSDLSEENFEALKKINNLSYIAAMKYLFEKKEESKRTSQEKTHYKIWKQKFVAIKSDLESMGWSNYAGLEGRTGSGNIDIDLPCVLMKNVAKKICIIAFHGSCSGSKFNPFSRSGDWGSNHDKELKRPSQCKLKYLPESLRVHSGFGDNLASVQDSIIANIKQLSDFQISFTGHSRGGAMAKIAAAVAKSFLRVSKRSDLKVNTMTLSAPRVFDVSGATWVNKLIHPLNILRIKVNGDWVTDVPGKKTGYSHVGIVVNDRIEEVYEKNVNSGRIITWLTDFVFNYHYMTYLDGMLYFDPEIVIKYSKLKVDLQDRIRSYIDLDLKQLEV